MEHITISGGDSGCCGSLVTAVSHVPHHFREEKLHCAISHISLLQYG